eukprot:gene5678-2467_t
MRRVGVQIANVSAQAVRVRIGGSVAGTVPVGAAVGAGMTTDAMRTYAKKA